MDTKDLFRFSTDNKDTLFTYLSVFKSLPDDFTACSHASAAIPVDSLVPFQTIIETILDDEMGKVYTSSTGRRHNLNLRTKDGVAFIQLHEGVVVVDVISSKDDASKESARIIGKLEKYREKNEEENGVWIDCAYLGDHGPVLNRQFIRAPKWSEVRTNYPGSVRDDLERLMKIKEPWKHGRLIIMHGPPGTGKTYGIRSLLMEWRDRFNFIVITDPEKFTANPSYYYGVASEIADMPARAIYPSHDHDTEEKKKVEKHHLFILEDTADLLLESNRATHGDKIGKLLNMTDGLFGQGREDGFLLTFNENAEKIDKAFLRPGRCLLNTKFPPFESKDAEAWLLNYGIRFSPGGQMTLAEMYAKVNGLVVGHQEPARMGFRR